MATYVKCEGCGTTLKKGFLGGDVHTLLGKDYCLKCYLAQPKYLRSECHDCSYYFVDESYNGRCSFDHDRIVDRNEKACKNYK